MANPIIEALTLAFRLLFPGILMSITAILFIAIAILNPHLLLTFQIDKIREKSFAIFWATCGSTIAKDFPPDLTQTFKQHCHGDILDIGPGSGFQLHRFKEVFDAGEIKHIYGVEPSTAMHEQLRDAARETFNGKDVYTIITSGAQPGQLVPALNQAGLAREKFDTIVCLRALCGIPQPRETAQVLYGLLKPGGSIIVLEHVVSQRPLQGLFQNLYTLLGWQLWNGGCDLRRDTLRYLKDAAGQEGWAEDKMFRRYEDKVIPEIYGYLKKRD